MTVMLENDDAEHIAAPLEVMYMNVMRIKEKIGVKAIDFEEDYIIAKGTAVASLRIVHPEL